MKKMNHQKIRKSIIIALLCTIMTGTMFLSGCGENNNNSSAASNTSASSQVSIVSSEKSESAVSFDEDDTGTDYDESNSTAIKLNGSSAEINGSGAALDGNTINITAAGTYIISGTIDDGQIVISAGKDDTVKLVLDNASINSKTTAAIYAEKCDKTILLLSDGTTNTISDGSDYTSSEDSESEESSSVNAAVFCKDDLTILGEGTLNVTGNSNNGITSKDTLRISSGTINVTAAHHGITGKDNLAIEGGTINVTATTGDGLRSTYSDTDNEEKGHIFIENASVTINAGKDGIQAEKNLTINSGTFNITTGGGAPETTSNNDGDMRGGFGFGFGMDNNSSSSDTTDSIKGLKADLDITINGGTFTIDAYDDAVHCNGDVTITGGTFTIATGDDGIHADNTLTITNGNITISQSYEGLEGTVIDISGGTIDLTASDDGINASGGSDNSGFGNFDGGRGFGRFAGQQFDLQNTTDTQMIVTPTVTETADATELSTLLTISGGTVYVNAQGDGLDSNGDITISGGTVVVNGTTQGGDGILDHDGTFTLTGGTIIGSGTYDMLEMPSESSSQKGVAVMFTSAQSAGTLVYITDSSGNILAAMAPEKNFSCIVYSSSELKDNETYSVYVGGTAAGDNVHGYYIGASVSGGTQYTTFTVSDTVNYVNESGNTSYSGMGGGMMGGKGNRGGMNFNDSDMGNMTPPDRNDNMGDMTPPDRNGMNPQDNL